MSTYPFHFGRALARALNTVVVITFIALVIGLSSAAFGANPAEEMAKMGTTDPKGDSWRRFSTASNSSRIRNSCCDSSSVSAWPWPAPGLIAWHPRRSSLLDPLSDLEERKALILLGMVGAIIAELSGSSQTLAFVIFGIGALLRFRTALDNPKLTGKAITVVVVGLACGMGSWAMAVFVTVFSWLLVYWLDSHASCRIRIRLEDGSRSAADLWHGAVVARLPPLSTAKFCALRGQGTDGFLLYIPAGIDPKKLESEMRAKLKKSDASKIDIEVG